MFEIKKCSMKNFEVDFDFDEIVEELKEANTSPVVELSEDETVCSLVGVDSEVAASFATKPVARVIKETTQTTSAPDSGFGSVVNTADCRGTETGKPFEKVLDEIFFDQPNQKTEVDVVRPARVSVEAQTDFTIPLRVEVFHGRDEIRHLTENVNFIRSVMKLKQLLSTKCPVDKQNVSAILKCMSPTANQRSGFEFNPTWLNPPNSNKTVLPNKTTLTPSNVRASDQISTGAVKYLMKNSNIDDCLEKSIDFGLNFLKRQLLSNCENVVNNWSGSLLQYSTDCLIEATQLPEVRHLVFAFVTGLLDDFQAKYNQEQDVEPVYAVLELFAKSLYLAFDITDYLLTQLTASKDKSLTEHLIESKYHTLKLLYKTVSNLNQLFDKRTIVKQQIDNRDMNIIDLWKSNWRCSISNRNNMRTSGYRGLFQKWLSGLDILLMFYKDKEPLCVHSLWQSRACVSDLYNKA